jgi:hypothetical protein
VLRVDRPPCRSPGDQRCANSRYGQPRRFSCRANDSPIAAYHDFDRMPPSRRGPCAARPGAMAGLIARASDCLTRT